MTDTGEKKWRCTVCGYIHSGERPPEICPICGASAAEFEPYREPARSEAPEPDRWKCLNCNFVHAGARPPETCPVCGVKADRFDPMENTGKRAMEAGENSHIVIIGGGIAGVSAAESIRGVSDSTEITLISKEADIPYYRLNLTRFLAGEVNEDALPLHPKSWYEEKAVDLRISQEAEKISPEEKRVQLRSGEKIPYDTLVIACGAHAFKPPLGGMEKRGVFTLRSYGDAIDILSEVQSGGRVLCIGGGLLGLETAGALLKRGIEVTLLEVFDWLMPRQLNRRAGELLEERVGEMGLDVRKRARIEAIRGGEHMSGVRLEGGEHIDATTAIIAAGVRANSHLARSAALHVNSGIVVDDYLGTSARAVYAAGDAAEHNGVLYGSWSAAQYQGTIAGLNALGIPTVFGGIPRSHTLKVLGIDMMSIGHYEPEDGSYRIVEEEIERNYFRFVFRDGCMVGCVLLGDAALGPNVKKLIETRSNCSKIIGKEYGVKDILEFLKAN